MDSQKNPIGAMLIPFEGECDPDTLILAPTRELVVQIFEEVKNEHTGGPKLERIWVPESNDNRVS